MDFDLIQYITGNRQLGSALAAALDKYHVDFRREHPQAERCYGPLAQLFFSQSALLAQDHNHLLNFYNFSAARIFGYSPQEAMGLESLKLVPAEVVRERADIFRKVIAEGQAVEVLDNRITKEGRIVRINALIFPYELDSRPSIAARVELLGADGKRVVPLITPETP